MQTLRVNTVTITPGFLIQLAAAILLLPVNWVIGWLLAAAFHEFCHYIALCYNGVRVFSIKIGFSGAIIETEHMQPKQELFSALAGPLGGFLLLIFLQIFPRIAICAFIQSLFNLLPIYPFDGGRAIRAMIACFRSGAYLKNPLQMNKSNSTISINK
jgi:membrane-associated protease RseP (regulator of RpoE activity)